MTCWHRKGPDRPDPCLCKRPFLIEGNNDVGRPVRTLFRSPLRSRMVSAPDPKYSTSYCSALQREKATEIENQVFGEAPRATAVGECRSVSEETSQGGGHHVDASAATEPLANIPSLTIGRMRAVPISTAWKCVFSDDLVNVRHRFQPNTVLLGSWPENIDLLVPSTARSRSSRNTFGTDQWSQGVLGTAACFVLACRRNMAIWAVAYCIATRSGSSANIDCLLPGWVSKCRGETEPSP